MVFEYTLEVLLLLSQWARPENALALCLRRQLTAAEMMGMPPAKVRDSAGAQQHIFLLSSEAQMFLRDICHLRWGNNLLLCLYCSLLSTVAYSKNSQHSFLNKYCGTAVFLTVLV